MSIAGWKWVARGGIVGFALVLFAWLSVYRERLVPFRADAEQAQWLLTGDEPSYLLMATALARGDGLNVRPAHEAGDYRRFQRREVMWPGYWTWDFYRRLGYPAVRDKSRDWGDAQVLQFSPLLPACIAPFIQWVSPVRWWMAVAQAFLVALAATFLVAGFPGLDIRARWDWALALFLMLGTLPIGYYTTQIFPETLVGLLWLGFCFLHSRSGFGWRGLAHVALLLSLWGTPRVLVGVAAVSVLTACRAFSSRQWGWVALHGLGWTGYTLFNLHVWGSWLPPQGMGFLVGLTNMKTQFLPVMVGALLLLGIGVGLVLAPNRKGFRRCLALGGLALVGLALGLKALGVGVGAGAATVVSLMLGGVFKAFFANNVGLLFLSPVMVVGLAAAGYRLFQRRTPADWMWLALFVGALWVVAAYPDTRAGRCPAGRYQVLLAWLLIYPVCMTLADGSAPWRRRMEVSLWALGLPSVCIAAWVAWAPHFWFRLYHPLFGYERLQPCYAALPNLATGRGWLILAIWVCVFFAIMWGAGYARTKRPPPG